MGTPFEEAGYTKDTVFEVLYDQGDFHKGDLVILGGDDGTSCPYFTVVGGYVGRYLYLPGESSTGGEDLKLHSNQGFRPITSDLLGEPGSDKYEAIRLVLKVLDGDDVRYNHQDYSKDNWVRSASRIVGRVIKTLAHSDEYALKSEDESEKDLLKEQEKQRKIQELEDTIKSAQEQVAAIKNS